MKDRDAGHVWSGFWTTSLGTLVGRVLGLVRDMATAALLGLGETGAMDALVIAFRAANLPRRILGEGALATSFLPVFTAEYQREPRRAWQLTSALVLWLTVLLSALMLLGELVCAVAWTWGTASSEASQLIGLTATLLPYAVFVCLAAQISAALQGLLFFRTPALAPALLNVCWLAAAWFVAPRYAPDTLAQTYIIALAILISGVLQLASGWWALRGAGFRFEYDWAASRDGVWQVASATAPIALGLAVTQLNTVVDSLIAWTLSADVDGPATIAWLGGAIEYPMQSGAAAAIYYGERFYQLPIGLLGMAVATTIYPLLSRHAARGEPVLLGADLTLGLRLVWFTALPAGVGIMLVARPVVRVLFERGQFTEADGMRAAAMIACYASGIWAYSAIPVLVRGFYAIGDRATPARLGAIAVAFNLLLNLTLVWPMAERGLAVATATAAAAQVAMLTLQFSRTACQLHWNELARTLTRGALATGAMAAAVVIVAAVLPSGTPSRTREAIDLAVLIVAGIATYVAAAQLLRMKELKLLLRRPGSDARR